MEARDYIVIEIQGEYAVLQDISDNSQIFIAMALLPVYTDVDTKLHYENLMYQSVE